MPKLRASRPRWASRSATNPPMNPPIPEHCVQVADTGVAEAEQAERDRNVEDERRTGDDGLGAVEADQEPEVARAEDRTVPGRDLVHEAAARLFARGRFASAAAAAASRSRADG